MLVAVYGTLRRGDCNHAEYLEGFKPLAIERLDGFEMYNLGGAYPYIARGADSITIEVYDVPQEVLERIADMELGAGYVMVKCKTSLGMADIFIMTEVEHARNQSWTHVPPKILSGDWFEWLQKYKPERLVGINVINIGG